MTHDPTEQEPFAEALRAYRPVREVPVALDMAGDWEKLRRAMQQEREGSNDARSTAHVVSARRLPSRRVAVSVIAAFVSVIVAVLRIGSAHSFQPLRTYATRVGQRATITLADGSTMLLAPRTTAWVQGTRVMLVGEAYFSVRHAIDHPFAVNTGTSTIKVLGTSFEVRRYADDRDTRVVVVDGKVSVGTTRVVVASAGDIVRSTDSSLTLMRTDVAPQTSWTTGRLVFHRAPVPEVLATIERWYGVRFRLADPALAERHLTTALDLGATTEVMRELCVLLNVSMTPDGTTQGTILLSPRRPNEPGFPKETNPSVFPSTTSEVGR